MPASIERHRDRRAVRRRRARATRRAARASSSASRRRADGESPCAERDPRRARARAPIRRPVTDADRRAPLQFYEDGRASGGFDAGIERRADGRAREPGVPVSRRLAPSERCAAGHGSSRRRLRAGVAAVVLPLEQRARRGAAGARRRGRARRARACSKRRSSACSPTRAPRRSSTNFALPVARRRDLDAVDARSGAVPGVQRRPARRLRARSSSSSTSVLLEDRSVLELLTADHTFVNERLARHYGIPTVRGASSAASTLDDDAPLRACSARAHAAAHVVRRPHVARAARRVGARERSSGTPPTPPPPDVETISGDTRRREAEDGARAARAASREPDVQRAATASSIRSASRSRTSTRPASGATSDRDAATPIDAAGQLADGTPIDGPVELREALLRRPDQFVQTLTEKLMMYALGRSSSTTTCRRCARSCATPQPTTIGSRRSCWASCGASRSRCRRAGAEIPRGSAAARTRGVDDVRHQEASVAPHGAARRRRCARRCRCSTR